MLLVKKNHITDTFPKVLSLVSETYLINVIRKSKDIKATEHHMVTSLWKVKPLVCSRFISVLFKIILYFEIKL